MRLLLSRDTPSDGELSVYLVRSGYNNTVSLEVKEPNGEAWQVFRLNEDGTGTLHKNIGSSILKISKSTQIKLIREY